MTHGLRLKFVVFCHPFLCLTRRRTYPLGIVCCQKECKTLIHPQCTLSRVESSIRIPCEKLRSVAHQCRMPMIPIDPAWKSEQSEGQGSERLVLQRRFIRLLHFWAKLYLAQHCPGPAAAGYWGAHRKHHPPFSANRRCSTRVAQPGRVESMDGR